jgi:hypothetical protein
LRAVLTFHLILITWVFFRAGSLSDATTILSRVAASFWSLPALLASRLSGSDMLVSLALIVVLLGVEAFDERRPFWDLIRARPIVVRWIVYYALVFGLIVLGTWNVRQFVYMQF